MSACFTNKRLHKQGRVKNPSKAVSDMTELLEYLTQIITQVKKWGPSNTLENSDTPFWTFRSTTLTSLQKA